MTSIAASSPSMSAPVGTTIVSYRYTPPEVPPGAAPPPVPARADTAHVYAQPPAHMAELRVPDYATLIAQGPKTLQPRPTPPPAPSLNTRAWQGLKLAAMGAGAVATGVLAGSAGSWLTGGAGVTAVGLGSTLGFAALVQLKNSLFGLRHDGTQIRDATLLRQIMPMLMRTRQEASIVHEQVLDLRKTQAFVSSWNATHEHKISVFHLVLASICRSADVRPGLDRFVAGGRLFQRKDPSLSFVVKREFKDYSGLRTVKFRAEPHESLESLVAGMQGSIHVERKQRTLRPVEKETRFFVRLPTWLLSTGLYAQRFLDYYGLLPPVATQDDPMYTSVFAANLGSLGLDKVQHHLYDYGTASLFSCVGKVRNDWVTHSKEVEPGLIEDTTTLGPVVSVFWTFDERVNDGHYCAKALDKMGELVENPEMMLEERDTQEVASNLQRDRMARGAAQLHEGSV